MSRFLNLAFTRIELDHGPQLSAFLERHPQPLSGYTFAALVAWRDTFLYEWAIVKDTLLISCVLDGERHLLQPVGTLTRELADHLGREAAALPYPLRIVGVGDTFLEQNPTLMDRFSKTEDRETSNYIYRSQDLAELKGAPFAKKRNLLKQARELYAWSVEPLTPGHVDACREVLAQVDEPEGTVWTPSDALTESGSDEARSSLCEGSPGTVCEASPRTALTLARMRVAEAAALDFTLEHLGTLGQDGVLVSVEGRPAAFSIFEPQNPETAVVHFEKALRELKGLYQVVNQETARKVVARGFPLLNREEDLGDPGLRQAKSSYHPSFLARAWTLTAKAA